MSGTSIGANFRASTSNRWTQSLRSSAAAKIVLVLVPLVVYYESSLFVVVQLQDGYWVNASAKAAYALPFAGPLCAAAAAWDVSRLRRGRILELARTRSLPLVVARTVLPTILVGFTAIALSYLVVSTSLGARSGHPSILLASTAGTVVLATTVAGALAGWLLAPVVAAPAVAAATWLGLVYPPAMNPVWLRHLTGLPEACCDVAAQPPVAVFVAPAVLAAGVLAVTGVVLSRDRPRLWMAPPAALIVVGAFTVAAVTVRDIGDTPQVPRDAAELRCAGTAPQVCLWPERPDELGAIAAIARDVHDRLSAIGLEVPSEASESVTAAWSFVMPRDGDPVTTRSALARGLAPHVPECLPGQPPRDRLPWQAGSVSSSAMAVPYLQAWLEIQAGVPPEAVTVRYPASVTGYLAQALAEPIDEQLADYERAVVAVRTCAPITVATAS